MMFDKAEEYFAAQDEFRRYIADQVNPARVLNDLPPIDDHAARECFRIVDNLYDPATKTLSERNLPTLAQVREHTKRG